MKHLKSDLSLGERYHKMIAYMITKQGGLARAIYFWKKGQAHHLECFIKRLQYFCQKSHRQRNLVGYSPCGCKELDRTEATEHTLMHAHQILDR